MCNGEAQMAALNTFSYILAHSRGCANVALVSVRFGSAYYSGQIIARADSGITTLADLKGKTFCRPDPLSTSGWIVPSITLRANGIDPDTDLTVVDAGGHPQVVTAVLNGDCDAGATFVDARTDDQKADTVVIQPKPRRFPTTPSASRPTSTPIQQQQITDALLEIAADPANTQLLTDTYNWGGLAAAQDAFFDDFRQQLDAAGIKIQELVPTPAPHRRSHDDRHRRQSDCLGVRAILGQRNRADRRDRTDRPRAGSDRTLHQARRRDGLQRRGRSGLQR